MRRTLQVLAVGALLAAGPARAADYYQVSVTRKGQDLYRVDGTRVIIKTRYCYVYAYSEEAILRIDSATGFNVGELLFNNDKCDVEVVLK